MSPNDSFLLAAALIGVLALPLILKWVPPNPIYGFRTPATLANRELWYRANSFAGWALLAASMASAIWLGLIRIEVLSAAGSELAAFVLPLLTAVATCFIHLRHIGHDVKDDRN